MNEKTKKIMRVIIKVIMWIAISAVTLVVLFNLYIFILSVTIMGTFVD